MTSPNTPEFCSCDATMQTILREIKAVHLSIASLTPQIKHPLTDTHRRRLEFASLDDLLNSMNNMDKVLNSTQKTMDDMIDYLAGIDDKIISTAQSAGNDLNSKFVAFRDWITSESEAFGQELNEFVFSVFNTLIYAVVGIFVGAVLLYSLVKIIEYKCVVSRKSKCC